MSRFNSLKVASKLILSFGVLVAIILFSSIFSVTNISNARSDVEDMVTTFQLLEDVQKLREEAFAQSTAIRGLLLTGDRSNLTVYEEAGARFDEALAELMSGSVGSDQKDRLSVLQSIVVAWRIDVAARQIDLMRKPLTADEAKVMEAIGGGDAFQSSFNEAFALVLAAEEAALMNRREATFSSFSSTSAIAIAGGVLSLALAIAAGWALTQNISTPITALTDVMRRLTQQDYQVEVSADDRHDEIGEMARAVGIFKDSLIENQKLERAAHERSEKDVERAKRMESLIHGFEDEIKEMTSVLASTSAELKTTANSLADTARESTGSVTEVVEASVVTSQNVGTVATASTELSGSIGEIARQVTVSSTLVTETKNEANSTNSSMQDLAEAASRIGEIVTLIQDIAAQTNLLALNATIESARAGEAGRGFSIVAQEVKALAEQTTKATEEIDSQVQQVQAQTNMAVGAIEKIAGRISEIETVVSQFAAAIEEQEAATQEISQNAEQVATATDRVTENMKGVKQAAEQTGLASSDVQVTAEDLARHAGNMRQRVDSFLDGIKAC